MTKAPLSFDFDNTYARDLDGFYAEWKGAVAPAPKVVIANTALAKTLGLDGDALADAAQILSGSVAPDGAQPLAMAYAGHQFGGFSPQLGDGRALLLGEIIGPDGARVDIHLKGSGRTPFSRGGDGKAALGPVLREYLMGEAMHALGIPTTRALGATTTGENIAREGMKQGAVLARVAASHLRVGTFQFFAARHETDKVRQLANYAIARHDPDLVDADDKYLTFLKRVSERQAALLAKWLQVGFVHGVMNTDNMTISGETIDYGPCAFIDSYDPNAVFSSIDRDGRYAFGNQPVMAQWNLARLAEAMLDLIDPEDSDNAIRLATNIVNGFVPTYTAIWTAGMRAKIGLTTEEAEDAALINDMFDAMEGQGVDYTNYFRALAQAASGETEAVTALFIDPTAIKEWLAKWAERIGRDGTDAATRITAMNAVNPIYIPRNHLVEAALSAAENDNDLEPFKTFLDVLADPFTQRDGLAAYSAPDPDGGANFKTFCGT